MQLNSGVRRLHRHMTGQQLRLEPVAPHEQFAPCLGMVQRSIAYDGEQWELLELDSSIAHLGFEYRHVLVRSRRGEPALGGPEPAQIFILLVANLEVLDRVERNEPVTFMWSIIRGRAAAATVV